MQKSDQPEFIRLITEVLAFYKQDASEFALSVWWEACKGAALEQVRRALNAHAVHPEKGQFPPKPADIVRELGGTFTDRALLAWNRVTRAMSEVGAYASVDFGDPVIHETISQLGGWSAICRVPNDEQQFLQKRFCDFHRTFTTRGAPADAPLQLQGEHATENAAKALEAPADVAKRLVTRAPAVKRIQ
jgi:hypothetical protein